MIYHLEEGELIHYGVVFLFLQATPVFFLLYSIYPKYSYPLYPLLIKALDNQFADVSYNWRIFWICI